MATDKEMAWRKKFKQALAAAWEKRRLSEEQFIERMKLATGNTNFHRSTIYAWLDDGPKGTLPSIRDGLYLFKLLGINPDDLTDDNS